MKEKKSWRKIRAVGVAVLVIGSMTYLVGPANAVHDTGAFELDGNAVHNTTDDWDNVCHQVDAVACPSPVANTNGATAVSWVNDGTSASIFTGGGSKDPQPINQWKWKDGSVPDKDNLLHGFAARYSLTPNASTCPSGGAPTCEVLYFGSDRFDNSGDAQQGFWFFQDAVSLAAGGTFNGVHEDGDLLIVSDFSNGGSVSTINVYEWNNAGSNHLVPVAAFTNGKCGSPTLPSPDSVCAIVNPTNGTTAPWPYTDKSGNSSYLQGELYEGGINLSALNLGDRCFSAVASETRSSTSTTATLKDFVLGGFGHCGSTLTTTPKASDGTTNANPNGLSIGAGSVTAKDSANLSVSGIQTWSGSLSFHLCGPIAAPAVCDTGGVLISSTTVTQAATQPVVSSAATLTSAGRYCWRADFTSSTQGLPDASDSTLANECFTVNPVTPALDTQAGTTPVNNGQPVTDTATLANLATQPGTNGGDGANPPNYVSINASNGAAAGGKVTFTLLKADCSTLATGTDTNPQDVTPVGASNGPVSFTPDGPGTYHWKAQYVPATGDPNNLGSTHNGSCDDPDEQVVVNQIQPTMLTGQSWVPNDSATVSATGGGNLGGKVTFTLYDNAACSTANNGHVLYGPVDANVSGASPQTVNTSNTTAFTTTGVFYWKVSYTSTNAAQKDIASTCTENTSLTINN